MYHHDCNNKQREKCSYAPAKPQLEAAAPPDLSNFQGEEDMVDKPKTASAVQDANSTNARALLTLQKASVLSSVLQDARGLLAWVGLGAALVLTGNLAACLAAATVQEAWVLVCIRLRYEEVVRVMQRHMAELRESQREFDQLLR